MAEIRCPMCGKANPPGLEVCDFCGARLTPVRPTMGGAGGGEGQAANGEADVPDWLARIRSQASEAVSTASEDQGPDAEETAESEPAPRAPGSGGTGSLLDRLKSLEEREEELPSGEQQGAPETDEPGASSEGGEPQIPPGPPPSESPESGRHWLDSLEEAGDTLGGEARQAGEVPDWLQTFAEELDEGEDQEVPPWLARIRAQQQQALEAEPTPQEKADAAAEEKEKWWEEALKSDEPPQTGRGAAPPPGEAREAPRTPKPPEAEPGPTERPVEIPREGFGEYKAGAPLDQMPEGGERAGTQAILESGLEGGERGEEAEEPSVPEASAPQADGQQPPFEKGSLLAEPGLSAGEPRQPVGADQARSVAEAEGADQGERPEEELPHIPALIMGEDQETAEEEIEDIDLGSIELPQWLNELRDVEEDELEGERRRGEALEPAKLPSWLEAMRPLETIRPSAQVEPEEGQVIETSGPLAGLRGALSAEPIVAMPRQPSIGAGRLDITDRQFARAEILSRMIAEESEEIPAAGRRRAPLPILRWAISALLMFAILIPTLFQGQLFGFPARWPQELAPLITIVEGLPTDRPVLFVIDYDPASAPEMERVGEAFLDHAILRGLQVVTLSTRPSGPALAEHLLGRLGVPDRLIQGERYYDLGYLAGGESGVQLFASSPRQAALRGFRTVGTYQEESPWNTPILQDVDSLSDFAAVAVLTSGTESARNWVEQTRSKLGTRPLVMVLSMGISPIVRPYYEAREPQVDALLSGLPSAVAYEQVLGGSGGASNLWDAYGGGLWVAIGALSVGVAYGAAALVVELRRRISGDV